MPFTENATVRRSLQPSPEISLTSKDAKIHNLSSLRSRRLLILLVSMPLVITLFITSKWFGVCHGQSCHHPNIEAAPLRQPPGSGPVWVSKGDGKLASIKDRTSPYPHVHLNEAARRGDLPRPVWVSKADGERGSIKDRTSAIYPDPHVHLDEAGRRGDLPQIKDVQGKEKRKHPADISRGSWASSAHVAQQDAEDEVVRKKEELVAPTKVKKQKPPLSAGQPLEFADVVAGKEQGTTDPVNSAPMDARLRRLMDGSVHALLRPMAAGKSKSGEVLCTWFWGEEGESQVSIVMATLKPGGAQWEDLRMISSQAGRSAQNPIIFMMNSTLVALHTSQVAGKGQGTAEIRVLKSFDKGYHWTSPRVLFKESGAMVRNPPIRSLKNPSEWLLPVYYTPSGMGHAKDQYSVMKWSSDPASSWPQASSARISHAGQGLVQPAVVRLVNGKILAFLRDRNARNIHFSTSEDDGRSWKPPQNLHLPNNNKAVTACVLPSGAVVLMFTNSNSWSRKYPMSIAMSMDNGATWPFVRDLQSISHKGGCKGGCEFSYPSLAWSPRSCNASEMPITAGNGSLHMTYTYSRSPIRRAAIRYVCVEDPEAWIRSGSQSEGIYQGTRQS